MMVNRALTWRATYQVKNVKLCNSVVYAKPCPSLCGNEIFIMYSISGNMEHQLEDIWSYNNSISNVIILISPPTLLILLWITPAPYGRYHNFKWFSSFLDIPGRIGWIVMESPNIWMPLVVYMLYPCRYLTNLPNKVLFSLYIIHYLYRYVKFRRLCFSN